MKKTKELRIKYSDFEVKSTVGRGHFGEVQVVHERTTGTVYAMKVLRKSDLLSQPDVSEWMRGRSGLVRWPVWFGRKSVCIIVRPTKKTQSVSGNMAKKNRVGR